MSGVVHLHRKVAGSLNLGFLPTYLVFFFFLGGCLLIPNGGSITRNYIFIIHKEQGARRSKQGAVPEDLK